MMDIMTTQTNSVGHTLVDLDSRVENLSMRLQVIFCNEKLMMQVTCKLSFVHVFSVCKLLGRRYFFLKAILHFCSFFAGVRVGLAESYIWAVICIFDERSRRSSFQFECTSCIVDSMAREHSAGNHKVIDLFALATSVRFSFHLIHVPSNFIGYLYHFQTIIFI